MAVYPQLTPKDTKNCRGRLLVTTGYVCEGSTLTTSSEKANSFNLCTKVSLFRVRGGSLLLPSSSFQVRYRRAMRFCRITTRSWRYRQMSAAYRHTRTIGTHRMLVLDQLQTHCIIQMRLNSVSAAVNERIVRSTRGER